MMPTKPIGPASDTATPVPSDAAKNASRCTPSTGTPRVPACSAPSASAFRLRGSHANATMRRQQHHDGDRAAGR